PIADRPVDAKARELVEQRLGWREPHPVAPKVAAKWSVSELKRRARSHGSSQGVNLPTITEKPQFLLEQKANRLSGAEKGTLMHLIMQHLDLRRPLDQADLDEQIAAL